MRASKTPLRLLLAGIVFLAPGCVVGSPLAAFSGEPYGMVRDDVRAIGGRNGPIWAGAPVFAVIDIPFAFVLDTGLLPISGIMWLILHAGEDAEEEGFGEEEYDDGKPRRHRHEDGTVHTH